MFRRLLATVLVGVLLTGCVTTPETEPTPDDITIPVPYGAKEFCKDNPTSELCESDEE